MYSPCVQCNSITILLLPNRHLVNQRVLLAQACGFYELFFSNESKMTLLILNCSATVARFGIKEKTLRMYPNALHKFWHLTYRLYPSNWCH